MYGYAYSHDSKHAFIVESAQRERHGNIVASIKTIWQTYLLRSTSVRLLFHDVIG